MIVMMIIQLTISFHTGLPKMPKSWALYIITWLSFHNEPLKRLYYLHQRKNPFRIKESLLKICSWKRIELKFEVIFFLIFKFLLLIVALLLPESVSSLASVSEMPVADFAPPSSLGDWRTIITTSCRWSLMEMLTISRNAAKLLSKV